MVYKKCKNLVDGFVWMRIINEKVYVHEFGFCTLNYDCIMYDCIVHVQNKMRT